MVTDEGAAMTAHANECKAIIREMNKNASDLDSSSLIDNDDAKLLRKLVRMVRTLCKASVLMVAGELVETEATIKHGERNDSEASGVRVHLYNKLVDFVIFALVAGVGAAVVHFS